MSSWGQRVASVGILVAFLACLLGAVAPYWRYGQLLTNSTGYHGGISSISKVEDEVEYDGGLFYFCVNIPGGGRECDLFDIHAGAGSEQSILWLTIGQVFLAFLSLMTSLCCLFCVKVQSSWYRCQAVLAGIAGLSGVVGSVMYLLSPEDIYDLDLHDLHTGWCLAVYVAGAVTFTLISLVLCLAAPDGACPCLVIRRRGYEDVEKQRK